MADSSLTDLFTVDCLLDEGDDLCADVRLVQHAPQLTVGHLRFGFGGHISAGEDALQLGIEFSHLLESFPAV